MIGSGYCFGLNIPTDQIQKQIAFNVISIACSFTREWSTEKHKFFGVYLKILFSRFFFLFIFTKNQN